MEFSYELWNSNLIRFLWSVEFCGFWSYVREQTITRTKMSDLKDESAQVFRDSKEKAFC